MTEAPFEPHRIWNMDKCGSPTVLKKMMKVIGEKGKKRISVKTSAERETNVTLALSVSASGQSIPPFYLYPRRRLKEIYMTHAAIGSMGVVNGSGWMTSEDFIKYMQHFIKHANSNKEISTLSLLNNHPRLDN